MSYFHNSYSTLLDAWGDDFSKKKQKQKKKSNSVCNLYESRNAPVTKPYVSKAQKSNSGDKFNNEDEHFYDKYYGYSDAQKYSNKRNQINKYNKNYSPEKTGAYDSDEESFDNFIPMHASSEPKNSTCFTTAEKYKKLPGRISTTAPKSKPKKPTTMRNQFMYIDEENDTDEEPELKQPVTTRNKTNDTFYDSDEEFDEYMESKMLQRTIDAEEEYDMMIKGNNIDEEYPTPHRRHSQEESEEQYDSDEEHSYSHEEESMYLPKKRKTKVKKSMRVPPSPDDVQMELMLYTVTGVIFIFIMEQFVQIGMKLKKVPI